MSQGWKNAAGGLWRRGRPAAVTLGRWLVAAVVIGGLCGGIGTAFHLAVDEATRLRGQTPWLLYLLPLAGLAIVQIYKATGTEGLGTNDVIDAVQDGKPVALLLLPAIFLSTVLTHLTGGSAGREGAALQMGGDIGWQTGRLLHLSDHGCRTATLCGMAAFFTALFGTPLAATLFAMMVVNVGLVFYAAFLPALGASLVAYSITQLLGVAPTRYAVTMPGWAPGLALRTLALGLACALVTQLFCRVLRLAHSWLERALPNPWLRVPAGFGAALGLAAVFCGATNCLVPSIVLAVELFGAPGLLYYAIVCGVSYTLSGYSGLYSHQHFLTDKLGTEYRSEIHPHHPAGFGDHPPL